MLSGFQYLLNTEEPQELKKETSGMIWVNTKYIIFVVQEKMLENQNIFKENQRKGLLFSLLTFASSKSTIEVLGKGVKYIQC